MIRYAVLAAADDKYPALSSKRTKIGKIGFCRDGPRTALKMRKEMLPTGAARCVKMSKARKGYWQRRA
jgi:hypothetical protein